MYPSLRLLAVLSLVFASSSHADPQPHSKLPQLLETQRGWTRPNSESIEFLGLLNRASLGLTWREFASNSISIQRVESALSAGLNSHSFGLSPEDGKSILLEKNSKAISLSNENLDVLFLIHLEERGFQNTEKFATSKESKKLYLTSFKGQIDSLSLIVLLPSGTISLDVSAGPRYAGWKCHGHGGMSMCGAGMPNNWCEQISSTQCIGG